MCVDPNLSRRRQRRLDLSKEKEPKRHRPWSRIFFTKGRTSTRRQTLERLRLTDALSELHHEPSRELESFVGEMIAEEDVEASHLLRYREDVIETGDWRERNPYASANLAA
jgi:hypothetical protein